jgi:hypothetical protein
MLISTALRDAILKVTRPQGEDGEEGRREVCMVDPTKLSHDVHDELDAMLPEGERGSVKRVYGGMLR